jgi:hypothetical protein
VWDTFAVMTVVRPFVVTGLDEAAPTAGHRRGLAVATPALPLSAACWWAMRRAWKGAAFDLLWHG